MMGPSAERTTRTDGNRRGNRLEHSQARFNLGAAQKNGLNCFGDPVAANLVRAEARHQAHDQRAGNGYQDDPQAQVCITGRSRIRTETVKEEDVSKEVDELQ
jgi:hypothetical protein